MSIFNAQLREVLDEDTSYHHVDLGANATEVCYAFTEPNVPYNNNWETGSLRIRVVGWCVFNDTIYLKVSGSRVNSDGEVQETTTATAEQLFDYASAKTYTFTIPSHNWGPEVAPGDRLRINYQFRNAVDAVKSVRIRTGYEDSNVATYISLHGVGTINSDAHIGSVVPALDFTGLTIPEVLKLIRDNDSGISINQNGDTLAEMLQKIAETNGIDIDELSPAEIIQKFDTYYS